MSSHHDWIPVQRGKRSNLWKMQKEDLPNVDRCLKLKKEKMVLKNRLRWACLWVVDSYWVRLSVSEHLRSLFSGTGVH